jgi:hypothetical protein
VIRATILVATWGDGLFAVSGEGRRQEIADLSVRGLSQDGLGGALAIVGGNSLRRRTPAATGQPSLRASSSFRAGCCSRYRLRWNG